MREPQLPQQQSSQGSDKPSTPKEARRTSSKSICEASIAMSTPHVGQWVYSPHRRLNSSFSRMALNSFLRAVLPRLMYLATFLACILVHVCIFLICNEDTACGMGGREGGREGEREERAGVDVHDNWPGSTVCARCGWQSV